MSRAEEFIQQNAKDCTNKSLKKDEYYLWLTPSEARRAVEIAREEMIEKACEYLDLHCNEVKTEDNGIAGWIDNEFINNFRQAMKDEDTD